MADSSGVPRSGAGVQPVGLDCPLRLRVGGKDVDATCVANGDRGVEATAGELSCDEVFAGDSGKLRAGFWVHEQGWMQCRR